jgi:hypothetical protein
MVGEERGTGWVSPSHDFSTNRIMHHTMHPPSKNLHRKIDAGTNTTTIITIVTADGVALFVTSPLQLPTEASSSPPVGASDAERTILDSLSISSFAGSISTNYSLPRPRQAPMPIDSCSMPYSRQNNIRTLGAVRPLPTYLEHSEDDHDSDSTTSQSTSLPHSTVFNGLSP